MMNSLYKAKHFLEEAMLGGASMNRAQSFVNESLQKAFSINGFSGNSYYATDDAIIGVGLVGNGQLEIAFDGESRLFGNICECFRNDLCRKSGLRDHQVLTSIRNRAFPFWSIKAGAPIGHRSLASRGEYGTLGCFLFDRDVANRNFIISNNHVLANSNQGNIGDDLYLVQNERPWIGQLEDFVPINPNGSNRLDLAIGTFEGNIEGKYRAIRGVRNAKLGEIVTKVGATTGMTVGRVRSLNYTIKVDFGTQVVFQDQLQIISSNGASFSQPGDSGSGIYANSDGSFVGLLFAGNGTETNANRGPTVAAQLKEWGYGVR